MEKIPTIAVLYHDDADGFGAAFACWSAFTDEERAEAIYQPVQYQQSVPDLPESIRELYIVDFSYDRETLLNLAHRFGIENLLVVDHHQTARDLADLPFVVFDLGKSGAVLTWERLHFPGDQVPRILQYVQDRDLWRFELPASDEINTYIASLPKMFETWEGNKDVDLAALNAGCAIVRFRERQIAASVYAAQLVADFMGTGHEVPVVNATANVSELGNALCKEFPEAPFSVSYADRKDGRRTFSLRSIGEFDVSEVAKRFGGGGHRNAAGFVVDLTCVAGRANGYLFRSGVKPCE